MFSETEYEETRLDYLNKYETYKKEAKDDEERKINYKKETDTLVKEKVDLESEVNRLDNQIEELKDIHY